MFSGGITTAAYPIPLDPEKAAKFSAALRSGDYEQTKGYLERLDEDGGVIGRCCLGVACRIAIDDGVPLHVETEADVDDPHTQFEGESGGLPDMVREWLGQITDGTKPLPNPNLILVIPAHLSKKARGAKSEWATVLNDERGFTFSEIADCVDATIAALPEKSSE